MPRDLYCLNCGVHFACHMKGQERFYEAWVPIRQVQEDTGLQHIREILGLNQASVSAIKKNKNFGFCKDCFKYLQTIKRCENEINEAKDDFLKQNKEGSFLYKRRNLKGTPEQDKVAHDRTAEQAQIPKVIFLTPSNTQKGKPGGFVQKECTSCICDDLFPRKRKPDYFWKAIRAMSHSSNAGYSSAFKKLVNGSKSARFGFRTSAQSQIRKEISLYLTSSTFRNRPVTLELVRNLSWNEFYAEIKEKLPFTYQVLEAILVPSRQRDKLKIDENGTVGPLVPVLGTIISVLLKQRKKTFNVIPSIMALQLFKYKSFKKAYSMLKDLGVTMSIGTTRKMIYRLHNADKNLTLEATRLSVPESKIFPLSKLHSQTEETGNHREMENESDEEEEVEYESENVENESDEEAENSEDERASEDEAVNDSEEEAENGSKSDTGCDEEAEERSLEKTVSSSSRQPVSRTSKNSTASTSGRLETESHVTAGSHVTAAWTESVLLDIDKDISVSDMSSAFMSLDDFGDTTCTESPVVGGSLELSENEVLPVIPLTDHEYAMSQKEKETGDCSMQNSHQSQSVDSAQDKMQLDELGDIPDHSESGQNRVKAGMRKKNKRKCHGITEFQAEAKKQKVVPSGESGATGVELGERNNGVTQDKANIKDKDSDISQDSADERQVAMRNESETTPEAISEDKGCTKDDTSIAMAGHVNTDKTSENSMPGVRKSVRKRQPNVRGMEIEDKVSRKRVSKSGKNKPTGHVDVDKSVETDVSEIKENSKKVVKGHSRSTAVHTSTLYHCEESKVQKNLEYLQSHGFQVTMSVMRSMVCNVVRDSFKRLNRNFDLVQGPSCGWFKTFLRRKNISGIPLKILSVNYNPDTTTTKAVEAYFVLLNSMIKDLGLEDKPGQIYNCGEFSLGDIAKVKLTDDGEDSSVDSSVGGQSSVQLAVSAAGHVMSPFFVVQNPTRTNLSETSEDTIASSSVVQGCLLESSDTGCMNEDLFCKWFRKVFLISRISKVPSILLMNNSSSFLCAEVIQSAILRRVHIIYTPPEVSHNLLPLDHSIFGLLKHHMKKNVSAEIIDGKELVYSVKYALSQLLYSDISQAFRNTCIFSYEAVEADADILSSKPACRRTMTSQRHVKKQSKKFSAPTSLTTTVVSAGQSAMPTNTVSQEAVPSAVGQILLRKNPVGTVSQNVVPSAVGQSQLRKNPVGTVSQNVVPSAVGQSQLRKNPVGTFISQYVARSAASQPQQQKNPVITVSQNVVPNVVGLSQLRKNPVGTLPQNVHVVRIAASQTQQQKNPVGKVSHNVGHKNTVALGQTQQNKSKSLPLDQLLQKPGITAVPHVIPTNCSNDDRFVIVQSNLQTNQISKQNIKKPNNSGFVEVKVWNSTGYTHLLLPNVGTKTKGKPDGSELLSSEINNSSNVVRVKEEPLAQGSSVKEQEASPVALYVNKANKQ